jgi:hypothetical protein
MAAEGAELRHRVKSIMLGCCSVGLGVMAAWSTPDTCWIKWPAFAFFVPMGCFLIFFGFLARPADLRQLDSPTKDTNSLNALTESANLLALFLIATAAAYLVRGRL